MAYLREKKMKEIENLLVNFTSADDDGEHRPGHGWLSYAAKWDG